MNHLKLRPRPKVRMNPIEHRSHCSTPKRISSKGHYQEPTSPQIIFLEYQPQQVIFQLIVSRNTESVDLDEHDISAKPLEPESYHEKAKEESPGSEKRVTSDTEKESDPLERSGKRRKLLS